MEFKIRKILKLLFAQLLDTETILGFSTIEVSEVSSLQCSDVNPYNFDADPDQTKMKIFTTNIKGLCVRNKISHSLKLFFKLNIVI